MDVMLAGRIGNILEGFGLGESLAETVHVRLGNHWVKIAVEQENGAGDAREVGSTDIAIVRALQLLHCTIPFTPHLLKEIYTIEFFERSAHARAPLLNIFCRLQPSSAINTIQEGLLL